MTTSIFDYVTITGLNGKQLRGQVVYVQPKADRWREQTANVDIVCDDINLVSEWLAGYRLKATYSTPAHFARGLYTVHGYLQEDELLRIVGTFECANDDAQVP